MAEHMGAILLYNMGGQLGVKPIPVESSGRCRSDEYRFPMLFLEVF